MRHGDQDYELAALAADWSWRIDVSNYTLLLISPFGDLVLRGQDGELWLLDVNAGELVWSDCATIDPARAFAEHFDDRLPGVYRQAGMRLGIGTCYGYKLPCVAGGSYGVENVYVAKVTEYVRFMGSFHSQIKDVEDGTKVRLKVVLPKPN